MSSSKVLSSVAMATQRVPIGTSEFIERYQRELEENSSIGQRLKMLEERHQIEIKRAYQRGFADGENAGLQRGLEASRKLESELRQTITTLANYHQTVYQNASSELLEMSFALANKIVSARGEAEKHVVIETINACLREVLDKTRLTVRVNPAQAEFVKNQVQSLGGMNEATAHITVESDSRIQSGGCIIETDSGNADGRLENQLQVLHQKLLDL